MWKYMSKKESDISSGDSSEITVNASVEGTGPLKNHIILYKDITAESIADFQKSLRVAEIAIREALSELGQLDIKAEIPIHLHIHSFGGSLLAGLAGSDAVSRTNFNTHVEGVCASAATLLSVCGKHRTMTKHSFFLIHELSTFFWGKHSELTDEKINCDRFMEAIKDIYRKHTKIPEAKLKAILKHDLYLTAEECLAWGIIDEIV